MYIPEWWDVMTPRGRVGREFQAGHAGEVGHGTRQSATGQFIEASWRSSPTKENPGLIVARVLLGGAERSVFKQG